MSPPPDDSDLVLQKADALMRRHRVFVAGGTPVENPPPAAAPEVETVEAPAPEDDDIPLLTEIVPAEIVQAPQTDALEAQRLELTQALEIWLDDALPQAILKVMDGVTDQLIAELRAQARNELLPRLRKDPIE